MLHVVLLGDSIFDNALYVPGEPPVIAQVKSLLPKGGKATLLAKDGAIVADVSEQIAGIPSGSSHLVLSVGGNDALGAIEMLAEPARNVTDALSILSTIRREFQRSYHSTLKQIQVNQKPLAVCTIYEAIPGLSTELQTALAIFNDTIVREALGVDATIIDLRAICTDADDFSTVSPIEPSARGGQKIASAIANWITSRPA